MSSTDLIKNKIVLIDDDEINNFVTRSVILQTGHLGKITDFRSAVKALEFLEGIGDDVEYIPEIIFLDLSMPVMDGFEFLLEFEKLPTLIKEKSKIVILTTSLREEDIENACKSAFVIKFLRKPLTCENFLALKT